MPGTRQSVKRQLSKKRRLLAILEEQIAGYTELEAPVSKLAERDQLREEVARLETLLASGELSEADEIDLSVWEGVEARIEPDEASLVHPSSPRVLLEKTGRTLMAVQLKLRRPAQPQKLMRIALGVLIALALLVAGFWIYVRLSAQLAPIPWPTPGVEVIQTPRLGFGDLWKGDPGVKMRLGDGVSEEQAVLYLEQRFSKNGIVLQFIQPSSPYIYVLYEDSQWEIYKGNPAVKSLGTPTGEVAVASSFRPIYEGNKSVRERLGSPQAQPREVQGTFQSFERGQMIWTGADDRQIYTLFVVDDQPDKWALYPDTWVARGDVVFASSGTRHWQIHTVAPNGSNEVPLTVEPADVDNFEPVWVPPERKSIAFVSTESGLAKI